MLRERGQLDEAEHLRISELGPLIAAREADPQESDVATRLAGIFAAEEERVANAAVLAELLLPLLTQQLRNTFSPGRAGSAAPFVESPAAAVTAMPRPPALTDIAGFIDQMIAQEDTATRRAS